MIKINKIMKKCKVIKYMKVKLHKIRLVFNLMIMLNKCLKILMKIFLSYKTIIMLSIIRIIIVRKNEIKKIDFMIIYNIFLYIYLKLNLIFFHFFNIFY